MGSTRTTRLGRQISLAWLLILAAASACQAQERHYLGVAYAEDTGQVRYREEHWLFVEQAVPTRLVLYRCPSGPPFARKWLRYTGAAWAPEFELRDRRDGHVEGARRVAGAWQVYRQNQAGAPMQTAPLAERADTVIDAGFDAWVQAHWNALGPGQTLAAAFLLPSRLDYLRVKLRNTGEDAGTRQLRMSLDSWLGVIAPSVQLTYAQADHRLIQFVGISDIRDASGHSQRVRIEFPASGIEPAPTRAQIDEAAALTLVDRCSD